MKISIRGVCGHICGNAPGMSIFDGFIVIMAFLELYLHIQDRQIGASVFRIIHLARLARILKFLRLPFFIELRALMDGLVNAMSCAFGSIFYGIFPTYAKQGKEFEYFV